MKFKWKKFFSILLILAVVFSVSVTSFAQENIQSEEETNVETATQTLEEDQDLEEPTTGEDQDPQAEEEKPAEKEEPAKQDKDKEEPKEESNKRAVKRQKLVKEDEADMNFTIHNYQRMGIMSETVYEDTIEVNKTAVRTTDEGGNKSGCRTYEVTLGITGTPPAKPVDVVLVIDTSTSMNTGGRMQATINAATSFANVVLGSGNPNNNRISIVNYGTNANHRLAWTSQLSTVTGSLSNLGPSGAQYTNIHQGFIYAGNRITGTGVTGGGARTEATKVVVMMSDGGANRYMDGSTTKNTNPITYPTFHTAATTAAYQQGQALQNIANVFTVGLFTGMPADQKTIAIETLQWSAPAGQFFDAPTTAELEGIYTSIAGLINYSAKDAIVKDKIGDNFELVTGSLPAGATYNDNPNDPEYRVITWKPGAVPGTIIESAQLKYKVQAKPGFSGGSANTNEYATLNYTDVNGNAALPKNFPVPEVNVPTLLEVSLTDAIISSGDSIALGTGTDPLGENYMSSIAGGDGNGTYTYEWRKVGDSTVIAGGNNPTVSPTEDTQYQLTVTDSNGCTAIATMWVRVIELIDIEVNKTWIGPAADSAEFTLYIGEDATEETLTLSEANNWSDSFKDLRRFDATTGAEIAYSVIETAIENYDSVWTGTIEDGFTVTNTYISPKIEMTGTKVWVDGSEDDRPVIEFQLYRNIEGGEAVAVGLPVTLDGITTYTWTNLDKTDPDGNVYIYTVQEVETPENYEKLEEGMRVTNTYVEPPTVIIDDEEIPLGGAIIPETDKPAPDKKDDLPKTGQTLPILPYALGMLSIAAGLGLRRKKDIRK